MSPSGDYFKCLLARTPPESALTTVGSGVFLLTALAPNATPFIPQARSKPVEPEYDRFDFEQQILNCWRIVDDIKAFRKREVPVETYDALAATYQQHFAILWDMFEYLLQEGKLK